MRISPKYGKYFSRLIPGLSGHFGDYIRKWLVPAGAVGVATGILTIILDEVVRVLLLGNDLGEGGFTGYAIRLYDASPLASFLLPFSGIVATGLLLRKFASEPYLSGTDEVLKHYHDKREGIRVKEGVVKFVSSIFTIGLGGSAGLEGPSINAGAVVGSWVWRMMSSRFGLTKEDLRTLLLTGASAGIAAIFKAPLTGIVFALEVPYKDDIARKAFLPSIIAGVTSYVTLASVEGSSSLFSFASVGSGFTLSDLVLSTVLGAIIGVVAVGFCALFHAVRKSLQGNRFPFMARFVLGAAGVGLIALVVRLYYTEPYTFGPGFQVIQGSLSGGFTVQFILGILVLRMLATVLTLGTGAVGGIFFPLVVFGSLAGSLFGLLVHGNVAVFASVGMAAFMSAGYKTPLAAVTFVGEVTGSASYLVPAMIGSAAAYIISGESTVSSEQTITEELASATGGSQGG
jgi:chloride channel protein, CIC family